MRISLVISVYNEAESIERLLWSINQQTVLPEEVIIVDGGSTDVTVQIIESLQKVLFFPLNLLLAPDSNRAEARNKGISAAKNAYIGVTDAGCVLDPQWVEEIFSVFKNKKSDVVMGNYIPLYTNGLSILFYWYLTPDNLGSGAAQLPSSRSIAFSGTAYESVGGYPEALDTCEDLVFADLLSRRYSISFAQKAVVAWNNPTTWSEFFIKVMGYAKGDVEAVYFPHLIRIISVAGRYTLFLFWPWLILIYLMWPWYKHWHKRKTRLFVALPIVQVVCDGAMLVGGLRGLLSSTRR